MIVTPIHSRKEQRFTDCHECQKTFSTKGTVFYRLHLGRDRGHRGDLARP